MCEPMHSIVQLPPEDKGPPAGGAPAESRLRRGLDKVYDLGKKIMEWFHYSKMGRGHHESLLRLAGHDDGDVQQYFLRHRDSYTFLPEHTDYEASWWDRKVRLDGVFHGNEADKGRALEAATNYANAVCIGSLTALRRFLETSLRKTDRHIAYVNAFIRNLIKPEGRDHVVSRLKSVANYNFYDYLRFGRPLPADAVEKVIKVLLGFTRQRKLIVCPWSDDDKLWTPGQTRDSGKPLLGIA